MCLVALKAKTTHTGVELDVDLHLPAKPDGGIAERPGNLVILHRLRHADADNALRLILRCEAEHQDRQLDAAQTQLLRLVDIGDRKIRRAELFQMRGNAHGAVPVGVRLDNAEQLGIRSHLTANRLKVMG